MLASIELHQALRLFWNTPIEGKNTYFVMLASMELRQALTLAYSHPRLGMATRSWRSWIIGSVIFHQTSTMGHRHPCLLHLQMAVVWRTIPKVGLCYIIGPAPSSHTIWTQVGAIHIFSQKNRCMEKPVLAWVQIKENEAFVWKRKKLVRVWVSNK